MSDLLAALSWYLVSTAAGLIALPVAYGLFRHLPDRGYAFARPLGLLLIGYAFWLLGSLGLLRNDVPSLLLAAALVGALGWLWLGPAGRAGLRTFVAEQRHVVLGIEAVFVLAFAGLAWLRAYSPDIQGTEKPMEFMFINSILRSPVFPPHDAWLSGHAISYYYFGYVLVAALNMVTGTLPEVGFNLAQALLFALTAVGALGVVLNLIALVPSANGRVEPWELTRRLRGAFWPALLGPVLVLVAGNYYGLLEWVYDNGLLARAQVPAVYYSFGPGDPAFQGQTAASNPPADTAQPGVRVGLVNLWDWLDLKQLQEPLPQPGGLRWNTGGNWFFASRVLHDRDLLGRDYAEAIDEMPSFSFLLGDVHPHVLALPFVVLAAALALEWLLWSRWELGQTLTPPPAPARADEPESSLQPPASTTQQLTSDLQPLTSLFRDSSALARIVLSAITLGSLAFFNTWDFPIYLFLTVLAALLGLGLRGGWGALARSWLGMAALGVVLAVLSVGLYLPFYFSFQSQAGGLLPNLIWPTRFQQSVVHFGPVLVGVAVYVLWLAYRGRAVLDRQAAWWAGGGVVLLLVLAVVAMVIGASLNPELAALVDRFIAPLNRPQAFALVLQRRVVDSAATLFPALMVGLSAGLAVGVLRRVGRPSPGDARPAMAVSAALFGPASAQGLPRRGWLPPSDPEQSWQPALCSPAVLFTLAMVLTGALLMLGPEFVYLRDNFGWRMNTLFKFYFQTWTLWALAAAVGAWQMARLARRGVRWLTLSVVGVAVALSFVYPLTGIPARVAGNRSGEEPTLNGMAYFARENPDEWAAIQWLRANTADEAVPPVVAEAVGGAYNEKESRLAMATGLPTVMGWSNHEGQWRGPYFGQVAERPQQIQTLYQVRDWVTTEAILDRYNIEYVVVGDQERIAYDPIYTPKFDQHMDVVLETPTLTLYRRKPATRP